TTDTHGPRPAPAGGRDAETGDPPMLRAGEEAQHPFRVGAIARLLQHLLAEDHHCVRGERDRRTLTAALAPGLEPRRRFLAGQPLRVGDDALAGSALLGDARDLHVEAQ